MHEKRLTELMESPIVIICQGVLRLHTILDPKILGGCQTLAILAKSFIIHIKQCPKTPLK